MSTYKNGPGTVPRLPDRVVDCLIDTAGVSRLASGMFGRPIDQTEHVVRLVHDTCEELLARLPVDEDGERWRFMMAAADEDGPRAKLLDMCIEQVCDDDPRPTPEKVRAAVDRARAMYAAGEMP